MRERKSFLKNKMRYSGLTKFLQYQIYFCLIFNIAVLVKVRPTSTKLKKSRLLEFYFSWFHAKIAVKKYRATLCLNMINTIMNHGLTWLWITRPCYGKSNLISHWENSTELKVWNNTINLNIYQLIPYQIYWTHFSQGFLLSQSGRGWGERGQKEILGKTGQKPILYSFR